MPGARKSRLRIVGARGSALLAVTALSTAQLNALVCCDGVLEGVNRRQIVHLPGVVLVHENAGRVKDHEVQAKREAPSRRGQRHH